MNVLSNTYEFDDLIRQSIPSVKANQYQIQLFRERVSTIISKIKELEVFIVQQSHYQNLKKLSDCLEQCLNFMRLFIVNSLKFFFLREKNYSSQFQLLNQSLKVAIQPLNLEIDEPIFNIQEDQEELTKDLIGNQLLIEKNHALLKSFLEAQLEISHIAIAVMPVTRKVFLWYQELNLSLQEQLKEAGVVWDLKNDQECYDILQSLSLNSRCYEYLKVEFIEQLAEVTLMNRFYFVDEDLKYPEFKECWNNYPELHLSWIKVYLKTPKEQFLSRQEWCDDSPENSYKLLQSLDSQLSQPLPLLQASLPSESSPSTRPLLKSSYHQLHEKFKQQLLVATDLPRKALAMANNQSEFSMEQHWNECQDLHLVWFKYCRNSQEPPILTFSSSQQTQVYSGSSQNSPQEEPRSKKLRGLEKTSPEKILEHQGFSLLSVTIAAPSNNDMKFFIGLSNERANYMLEKSEPITELDFKEDDIINLFDGQEKISEQELGLIKDYFKHYFVPGIKAIYVLKC